MKTTTQKLQRTIAGMFLALGIVSFASFAHAAKPHTDVIDETSIDDFLSDFCGFPVQVHVEATFIVSERGNAISVSGPYKVTWTNLETGESATGNSPVHIQQVATFGDEFIVLDVVNSGPFLVKGPHGGAAWIVAGHFHHRIVFDARTFEFISEEHISGVGHTEDDSLLDVLCELLSD